ncbi:SpaH/EbpB family LPXTG-anchored major pilin [Leucobacter albus]|uniref:SpaH/EbpB family LPXTG-anchored major pilin n=1 Tax=Leucobacter albus TaxID=272210 RepID=A0ABW3TLE2_9MICO
MKARQSASAVSAARSGSATLRISPPSTALSRGALAGALMALLVALAVLAGGPAALAADVVFPAGPKTLVIHAGAAPGDTNRPGLAPAETGAAGHTYEVKRVPGFRLETTVDWNRAVDLTPEEAGALTANEPLVREGETGADGTLVFDGLANGLYLVTETAAPAGAILAAPFLVVLPLPDPADPSEWLTTVHVTPKTARVDVRLGVRDAAAVTCGDPVAWASLSAIPDVTELASYRVQQVFAPGVSLLGAVSDTTVEITGQPALVPGSDYTVAAVVVDGREALETVFTLAGIAKLLADPAAELKIGYVGSVAAPGEYTNEVRVHAGDAGVVTDTATTKFGPLRLLVHEKGEPGNLIEGADFRLYASLADARASEHAITFAAGADLRTAADGSVTAECLRYSGFVDGLDREPGSELYRDYFAKPISYPAGWVGEDVILSGGVHSVNDPETLKAVVWKRAGEPGGPGVPPVLSETGGRVAAAALLGGVLVAVGVVAASRRRRERGA